jgi:hypothetical protein
VSPEGRKSWEEHEKMIENSEAFYQAVRFTSLSLSLCVCTWPVMTL